ncbi:MAG: patatin-like phospholipase family protein [Bacteroidaceae bacterium]|nr:patatin-like phospholipase family protein [Bacteroidaceae bacterium]
MRKMLLIAVAVLMCGLAYAQENDSKDVHRKKVAVVLSGGGAKGMAHIGVLKVLERAGIPVDIVTGTSMGSIIGGLYSIGYNANALDSMVRVQDWSYVITDKEDLRNQSLNDRKKQNTYFFSTGMTIGKRDMNAGGLIKGKNLAELFQQLCVGFTDSLDFSRDLPIPFACVATDIIDNSEVDFHSGRLPQAMRASMAIPAAFSPVRIGDKVLVDGGLRNNYPADIAREMGADIIIGVTVQGTPKSAEELGGTMSILSQIIDVNCKNKLDENLAITDLHLQVDTKGYGSASFSQSAIDTLIRRGEEEAMRHWDDIIALKKRIGIDESFRPMILHPLRPQVMTEKHYIIGFTFENMTPQDERFLRQKFGLDKRDSIDANLEQELTTSMRVDLFYQTAECRLLPEKLPHATPRMRIPGIYHKVDSVWSEADGVRVVLTAGDRKSVQLHAGVRYDTEEYAAVQLGLDIPLKTAIPINTDFTLRLGKRLMARGELTVHPRSFTRPTLRYSFRRNDVDIYLEGDRNYNIRYNQFQAEFIPINHDLKHFNIQYGLRWDYMHYRNMLGTETNKLAALKNEHFYSYHARINYNSEDNWSFPTRGARFKAEYTYLTDNFTQLDGKPGMSAVDANWRISFSFNSRFTIQPMLYGRLLFGTTTPPTFGNTIGGDWFGHYVEQQMPFAGIGNIEYVDHQFVAAQLQAQQRIGGSNYVLLRVAGAQQANKPKNLLDRRTLLGIQAAYYYNTMFGPIGATVGYSNRTKQPYFYLNLGYEF